MKNVFKNICIITITMQLSCMEKELPQTKVDPYEKYCATLSATLKRLKDNKQITAQQAELLYPLKPHHLYTLFIKYSLTREEVYLKEVCEKIAYHLIKVNHGSQKNFYQQLIDKAITLSDTIKPWKLPTTFQKSFDGKYYIAASADKIDGVDHKIIVYNQETQKPLFAIPGYSTSIIFKTKNLLLIQPTHEDMPIYKKLILCDLKNGTQCVLMDNIKNISFSKRNFAYLSPDEQFIAAAYNNKIIMWDITDTENILQHNYDHFNVQYIAFSPDNNLLASSTNEKNSAGDTITTELFLWKRAHNCLTLKSRYYKNIAHNLISFFNRNKLFLGNKSVDNPHCLTVTIDPQHNVIEEFHSCECSPVMYWLSDKAKEGCAFGSTIVVEKNSDTIELPEKYINFYDNTYTLYKPAAERLNYQISISPNEKFVALIIGKNYRHIPMQKAIILRHNNVTLLRDWLPSSLQSHSYEHDSVITFNNTSTLLSRGVMTEKESKTLIYNNKGKLLTECPGSGHFHPDGNSVLTDYGKQHILCTKKLQQLLRKTVEACSLDTYFFLTEQCLENQTFNAHNHTFKKFTPEEQNILINSFKLAIPAIQQEKSSQQPSLLSCTIS
jgi:hypothetical protein